MTTMTMNQLKLALIAGVGASGCIFTLAMLTDFELPGLMLMAPFGATMVIVFALPESPLAQPRNVFFGHMLAALVGLIMLHFAGVNPVTLALGVGLAVALMMLAGVIHPPAGANPLLIMMTGPSWDFLLLPVMAGAAVIIVFALIYHRYVSGTTYPQRWF